MGMKHSGIFPDDESQHIVGTQANVVDSLALRPEFPD